MPITTRTLALPTLLAATLTLFTPCHAQDFGLPVPSEPGITLRVFHLDEGLQALPELVESQTPNLDEVRPVVEFGNTGRQTAGTFGTFPAGNGESIFAQVSGWIFVGAPGEHRFRLISDDGSRLIINGATVVNHDGLHGATAMDSEPVFLPAGPAPLYLEYFDAGGAQRLRLEWQRPGEDTFTLIPTVALRTHVDQTRVTSPGYKNIVGSSRPGDGKPLREVHPMWEVSTFRPPSFEPMVGALALDSRGRLIVGTFDPLQRDEENLPDIDSKEPDKLYAVTQSTAEVVADGFLEPAGLVAVGEALYVAHRRAITKLTDTDGDGFYETHADVARGWEGWNYHQFTFGLVHTDGPTPEHPGFLYATLSTAMAPPAWEGQGTNATVNGPMRGSVIEVDLSIDDPFFATRVIAGGTRTPNGLGVGPEGSLWYADNQGTWMPTSQFSHIIPGRFYGHHNRTNLVPKLAERFPIGGHPSVYMDRARTPASILLPHGEISNSPTESLLLETGPYAGQMLMAELTAGGIRRVFLEKINGEFQGAVFRHTQGLESGVNRMIQGPDGSVFVGGIGADGNWKWKETQFGLQKLTPTGTLAFEMHSIRAQPDGFAIEFTKPIEQDWLSDPSNFEIESWTYAPDAEYGGPKVDIRDHTVLSAEPNEDGTRVRLVLDGFEAGRCYSVRTDPMTIRGEPIWSTEAWYTLNAIPRRAAAATIAGLPIDPNALGTSLGVGAVPTPDASILIGASSEGAMRRAAQPNLPRSNARTAEQVMALPAATDVGFGTGDLVSVWEFGDVRLHVEWLSPPGGLGQLAGNSGVYLQSRYEVQVLGTRSQADNGPAVPELNEAGAIYNVKRPDTNASHGPGQWQAYDIWFRAPRYKFGVKTSDARMTVYWNGVLVHDDVAIPGATGSAQGGGETPPFGGNGVAIGPLRFQDHVSAADGPVQYRNVWVAPLEATAYAPVTDWQDLSEPEHWERRGGQADFVFRNGSINGTSVPNTPNTFATSVREFSDFELLFEVKQDPELNSGVQIRSRVDGGFDNRKGGLIGKQVELDPSDRAYSGGIYDERGRGWIAPPVDQPYSRRAFRPGDWNRVRVLATGDTIRTWVNGVPVASLQDGNEPMGRLGLQVHDVGGREDPLMVEWRNIRIRELAPVHSSELDSD